MKESRNLYNGTIDENGKTFFGPPPEDEERMKENERIKKLTGAAFENYYQNHIKNATEEYASTGVYYRDKVNKSTAWEIWKEAWKTFEKEMGS